MDTVVALLEGQGIWCCLAVWMIYTQRKEAKETREWVQTEVLSVIENNTKVLAEFRTMYKNDLNKK